MIAVYLFPETKNSYNPAAINCLKYPREWLPLFTVFHIPVTRPRSASPEGHRGERHGSSLYSRAFELSLWNDLWNTSQMNYCCGYLKKIYMHHLKCHLWSWYHSNICSCVKLFKQLSYRLFLSMFAKDHKTFYLPLLPSQATMHADVLTKCHCFIPFLF